MAGFISSFAVGPLLGLAANGTITILCLVTLSLYRHYRPIRSLFCFYLVLTICFFGWLIYGLQKSETSLLFGYRIDYASLALLPACWAWFISALFNERQWRLRWMVTFISLILAAFALLGKGLYFFGLPLEPDSVALNIWRPQSLLLRPLIQSFCLITCLFYFIVTIVRLWRLKEQQRMYLMSLSIGLLLWFLGGLHDAIRATGVVILIKDQVLWFASLWLSIFLTIAIVLHFRSIEQAAREELEQLSRVKSKALDHLSHELRTPLSVIKGNLLLLRRMFLSHTSPAEGGKFFEAIEKQLARLINIQDETNKIIRHYQKLERNVSSEESNPLASVSSKPLFLYPFSKQMLENIMQRSAHRNIHFDLEGSEDLFILIDSKILEDILEGLLRNAIENTPDEGMIRIQLEKEDQKLLLKVKDFGVGITEENQKYIFDGLFHTQETELYASKRPFDFNAGGKGLNLLQIKLYGQCFNFDLWVESRRCIYLPTDRDFCPGKISSCTHCQSLEDCLISGGSTFCLSFPIPR